MTYVSDYVRPCEKKKGQRQEHQKRGSQLPIPRDLHIQIFTAVFSGHILLFAPGLRYRGKRPSPQQSVLVFCSRAALPFVFSPGFPSVRTLAHSRTSRERNSLLAGVVPWTLQYRCGLTLATRCTTISDLPRCSAPKSSDLSWIFARTYPWSYLKHGERSRNQ